jgi:hypothetical protein
MSNSFKARLDAIVNSVRKKGSPKENVPA